MEELRITIPESWEEVSIGKFCELQTVCNDSKDDVDRVVKAASILSDTDPAELCKISSGELSKISEAIGWMGELPSEMGFKHVITIDEVEYSLVPKLHELSVGEWIDLETYAADLMKNLHLVMGILYRPLMMANNDRDRWIEDYDASKLEARAEIFREKMSVADCWGACGFFLRTGKRFTGILQGSLMRQAESSRRSGERLIRNAMIG